MPTGPPAIKVPSRKRDEQRRLKTIVRMLRSQGKSREHIQRVCRATAAQIVAWCAEYDEEQLNKPAPSLEASGFTSAEPSPGSASPSNESTHSGASEQSSTGETLPSALPHSYAPRGRPCERIPKSDMKLGRKRSSILWVLLLTSNTRLQRTVSNNQSPGTSSPIAVLRGRCRQSYLLRRRYPNY